jgi:GT2 family glycosyltransferase
VTVVVPAYRAERSIRRTLDSLLLDPVVATIVVVIDGAFDRTEEVLSAYDADRVQVIARAENWGASRTRNQGLEQTSTEFVMFVDADDFVEGPLICGLAEVMRESRADVGFGPMQILHEREGRRASRFVPDFASPRDIFRKWHLEGQYVNPTSVMWRTDFIRRIGGWDPEITRNDDGELAMRAALLGAKIAVSSEGTGVYVKHSAETMNHRSDNLESLLRASHKLMQLPSPWLTDEDRREIGGGNYYNVAWHCFRAGRDDLGREALSRSRAMGFRGNRGPAAYRALISVLGLRRGVKLALFVRRVAARIRPSPA